MYKLLKPSIVLVSLLTVFTTAACKKEVVNLTHSWDLNLSRSVPGVDDAEGSKVGNYELRYFDDVIDIRFVVQQKNIIFVLENKLDRGITINWTEASFISPEGRSMRVVHKGTRLVRRFEEQTPTVIPPKALLEDVIIPVEHLHWESEGLDAKWYADDLLQGWPKENYVGKTFRVYLPMQLVDQKVEYTFNFTINGVMWSGSIE